MKRGKMKRGKNGSPAGAQGRPRACPEATPKEITKMSPNAEKNQGFSCFWEHFRRPSRPPSWLQILASSPVIRKSIFPPLARNGPGSSPSVA